MRPASTVVKENPFFQGAKRAKVSRVEKTVSSSSSSSGSSDSDSSDSDYDEDEEVQSVPAVKGEGHEDDGGEDPLIKALKQAKERQSQRVAPPEIRFSKREVMDISFNPGHDLIASSLIDGEMHVFEYGLEGNRLKKRLKIHKGTVRTVEFDATGRFLVSGSADRSVKITDIETSKVVFKAPKSHGCPLFKVRPVNEHMFATGDEDGTVKLWDKRATVSSGHDHGCVMESKPFDEFVSDIYFDNDVSDRLMVATSGEGTLQSFNIRGKRPDVQSEVYEGELTSLGAVHRNSKLVAGCGDGRLYMFNWGEFGYHSADFPGHPDTINDLVPVTDNIVITACEDGGIRAVHLYPHRFLGIVGHHDQEFPIEKLDVSRKGDLIASTSHDQKIRFWNIGYLEEMDYKKSKKPFLHKKGKMRRKDHKMVMARESEHQLPSSRRCNKREFFKDLS